MTHAIANPYVPTVRRGTCRSKFTALLRNERVLALCEYTLLAAFIALIAIA